MTFASLRLIPSFSLYLTFRKFYKMNMMSISTPSLSKVHNSSKETIRYLMEKVRECAMEDRPLCNLRNGTKKWDH